MRFQSPSSSQGMNTTRKSDWSFGLLASMADPALLLISTPDAVVIRDKYPKAEHHFLVLPKEDIPSIFHLSRKHSVLLRELHLLGLNATQLVGGKPSEFKMGFHAKPSMQRLHMHVISTDFNSPCMKTKKHWNSFNTQLFLPFEEVYNDLELNGTIRRLNKETIGELENSSLKCNKCPYLPKNMPDLKCHILTHLVK